MIYKGYHQLLIRAANAFLYTGETESNEYRVLEERLLSQDQPMGTTF